MGALGRAGLPGLIIGNTAEDLLSETRFRKLLSVKPTATRTKVLTLAGSDAAVAGHPG